MNQLKNIQFISSFFFYTWGFVIFGLMLLVKNKLYGETPLLILKSLDLPFILAGLLYGLTSLKLSLGNDIKSDMIDAVLIFVAVFAFTIALYLNFAFSDFI